MIPESDLSNAIELDRWLAKKSFIGFLRSAWPILDPGEPYVHNWHMDALGEHLEAVRRGEILRLLVNIPPGTSKSSACAVYFPAWLWTDWPEARFIGASYESTLATRDNRKTRLLIESEWYRRRWPIQITTDQNEKTNFENDRRGFRQSCAVASMTGKRGHVVVWDDPIKPEDANSPVALEAAIRIFSETLPSRLVSPERSAIIIIMQRLHENDVSGHILRSDLGYEHLCLPMEFEPDRRCVTSIGFADPRTREGELLFPARFPRHVVERDKKVMGDFAVAGQFQQRPAPRQGAVFHPDKIEIVDVPPPCTLAVRSWDLGATEGAGDPSASVKLGITDDLRLVLLHATEDRLGPARLEAFIKQTAATDGQDVVITFPQDPGQAGVAQKIGYLDMLRGYAVRPRAPQGSKLSRAMPAAAQVNAGNMMMVAGPWNRMVLDQLRSFPNAQHDDIVDALSDAYSELLELSSGGLWNIPSLTAARLDEESYPPLSRVVVGVCPPQTPTGLMAGIVLAGIDKAGICYVIADGSDSGGPDNWWRAAASMASSAGAEIVADRGHDGAEAIRAIRRVYPAAGGRLLNAPNGGDDYAQAVASLFASGKVFTAPGLGAAEAELLAYRRDDRKTLDLVRARALIFAVASLTIARQDVGASRMQW
jgi:predicted phage terminase large subunit-like protein